MNNIKLVKMRKSEKSPFAFIIYKFEKGPFLIEDMLRGKSLITNEYLFLNNYLQYIKYKSTWISLHDAYNKHIKINEDQIHYAFSLFNESYTYYNLSFNIKILHLIDINLPNFSIDNFALTTETSRHSSKYTNVIINAKLPIFQLYAIVTYPVTKVYQENKILRYKLVMNINNQFYYFPYGNTFSDHKMCANISNINLNISPMPEIREILIANLISTSFNNDLQFQLAYNKNSLLKVHDYNLNVITDRINNNQFEDLGIIDLLFYLSQTPIEKINTDIFVRSIDSEVRELETSLFKT